ncbi:MAG: hypothetical protein U0L12_09560 [Ruminococcus sp.]|nr:hypothetical protein [Ruminococcus sp.]
MDFLTKLERKFGRYALTNLTQYIIVTYVAGYLLYIINPSILQYITLEPYYILHGQIWRLVSWILIPPSTPDLLTIISLIFYYQLGTTLERTWGTFRYNVYIFLGLFMTIFGAFFLYFMAGGNILLLQMGEMFSTYYVSMSIFLGFAMTYPNMQVLFMMFIPLKIKWLGIVEVALLLVEMINGTWVSRVAIICSLMNVIIFFLANRNMRRFHPNEIRRKQKYQSAVRKGQNNSITKHKCAICGRTELDGDHLEFRFCSKCNGNYEYCQDHLFTHTHVQ